MIPFQRLALGGSQLITTEVGETIIVVTFLTDPPGSDIHNISNNI